MKLLLPDSLRLEHWFSPVLDCFVLHGGISSSWVSNLPAFGMGLCLYLSWFSGFRTQTGTKPSALLALQLAYSLKISGLASIHNCMSQLNYTLLTDYS